MAICPNCGAENPAKSKWCGKCGNTIPNQNKRVICLLLSVLYFAICFTGVNHILGLIRYGLFADLIFSSVLLRLILAAVWLILLLVSKPPLKRYHKVFGIVWIAFNACVFLVYTLLPLFGFHFFYFYYYGSDGSPLRELLLLILSIVCGILALSLTEKRRRRL